MGNCVDSASHRSPSQDPSQKSCAAGFVAGGGVEEDGRTAAVDEDGFRPLYEFSYNDLRAATRGFRPDSIVGQGGFGCVYKGYIDEQTYLPTKPGQGMMVAVKKLNPSSVQGHKEWLTEVSSLGELHHPNLVRLIGHCASDDDRLLVYEYMSRGSLDNHLFRRGAQQYALPWAIRMKIAVGAARGLAFLHNASRQIIFRDFKAANILLDSEYNAKLSDFGLAKDGPKGDKTHVSTRVMGTFGYAAPEYVATGHLTSKSDVYSFGVVLLEILTGREAIDRSRPTGEQNLVEWANPYLKDHRKVMRIVDPRLDGQYSLKGVRSAAAVATTCLCSDAKLRPTMMEVVKSLQESQTLRRVTKDGWKPSSRTHEAGDHGSG